MAKKPIKIRDYNMLNIIKGATKAGVQTDQRKQAAKQACRSTVSLCPCALCGGAADELDHCPDCNSYICEKCDELSPIGPHQPQAHKS